ncbi:MAG: hypothetical protein H5T41_01300 [Methanomassiliicoccales archaeon]|nr:hypothetical protein [Methanomassiliicoccales archaeon]
MSDRNKILEKVERRIRGIPGVVDMVFLDNEFKENIIALEKKAEENGAVGGLMPFTNKGVWEALSRHVSFIMIINKISIPEVASDHTIYLVDQKGQILGEYVSKERLMEFKDREDVCFLSDDFVLYSDVEIVGEPYFLIPEIEFHGLDGIEGITRVTSGSISTLSDFFVRCTKGYLESKHWTHLVGFDIAADHL